MAKSRNNKTQKARSKRRTAEIKLEKYRRTKQIQQQIQQQIEKIREAIAAQSAADQEKRQFQKAALKERAASDMSAYHANTLNMIAAADSYTRPVRHTKLINEIPESYKEQFLKSKAAEFSNSTVVPDSVSNWKGKQKNIKNVWRIVDSNTQVGINIFRDKVTFPIA